MYTQPVLPSIVPPIFCILEQHIWQAFLSIHAFPHPSAFYIILYHSVHYLMNALSQNLLIVFQYVIHSTLSLLMTITDALSFNHTAFIPAEIQNVTWFFHSRNKIYLSAVAHLNISLDTIKIRSSMPSIPARQHEHRCHAGCILPPLLQRVLVTPLHTLSMPTPLPEQCPQIMPLPLDMSASTEAWVSDVVSPSPALQSAPCSLSPATPCRTQRGGGSSGQWAQQWQQLLTMATGLRSYLVLPGIHEGQEAMQQSGLVGSTVWHPMHYNSVPSH